MTEQRDTVHRGQALLTPSQVAERLQFSQRTVAEWLRWGKLPGVKIGNKWRVSEQDLAQFVAQQRP